VLRDPNAPELRSVAPLIALGNPPQFIGPVTLVSNGSRVVGVTGAELLREHAGAELVIATRLDGSATLLTGDWMIGRYAGVGLIDIDDDIPPNHDLQPLSVDAVHASLDVHGAASAIVTIEASGTGFERSLIPIDIDRDDGGMSDQLSYVASPQHPAHASTSVVGAIAFAWLPPDPALGRPGEVVAFGLSHAYTGTSKPRATTPIAELVSLEDLGRALIGMGGQTGTELDSVTGEIASDSDDPLEGLE